MKAINKVITHDNSLPKNEVTKVGTEKQKLFVKGDKKHYYIDAGEILFIEAYGNYTNLFLKNDMIISHEKISYYENFLKSNKLQCW